MRMRSLACLTTPTAASDQCGAGQVTLAALEASAAAGISRHSISVAKEKLECSSAISSLSSAIKLLDRSKVEQCGCQGSGLSLASVRHEPDMQSHARAVSG